MLTYRRHMSSRIFAFQFVILDLRLLNTMRNLVRRFVSLRGLVIYGQVATLCQTITALTAFPIVLLPEYL